MPDQFYVSFGNRRAAARANDDKTREAAPRRLVTSTFTTANGAPRPVKAQAPKRSPAAQRAYDATMKAESARILATMTAIKDHPLYRGREAMADKLAASGCTVAQIHSALQVARATLPTPEEREADREAVQNAMSEFMWNNRASGSARA